jgi:hypothetical protein
MAPDTPNILLNLICFFFPVIGAVVCLAIKDVSPRRARSLGKATLFGVITYVFLALLLYWGVQQFFVKPLLQEYSEMLDETSKKEPTPKLKTKRKAAPAGSERMKHK